MNTRRLSIVALVLVLLLPAMACAGKDSLSDAMTRQLQVNRQRYGTAGQALLVTHNGKEVFRGVDGYANLQAKEKITARTVFPVYSLSKRFVSTLVMQLVEQGTVDLDKPASVYLQGLPDGWRGITVRQFLNHTSGVPDYFSDNEQPTAFPASMQDVFASLGPKPMLFAPGTRTRYTQTNYLVLSALLEAHYGQPYPQIAGERIIRKLGLKHTWLGRPSLPASGVALGYLGKNGKPQRETEIAWPAYSYGHAELYLTLDDLARFLQALSSGELVSKASLQQFWQPQNLSDGRRGDFSTGWEYGESGAYRHAGHDGGARVRVRVVYKDSLDDDTYVFIYLSNGSAKNVWSRTLIGSAMATVAPDKFPAEVLSEKLIVYALSSSTGPEDGKKIRSGTSLQGEALERTINNSGYAALEFLSADAAIRVLALNTEFFPASANAWDSLADGYKAKGEQAKAQQLYDKARQLQADQQQGQAKP